MAVNKAVANKVVANKAKVVVNKASKVNKANKAVAVASLCNSRLWRPSRSAPWSACRTAARFSWVVSNDSEKAAA